jgi:tripartite-type tricarboxylate transporter receptor subunit TctC
MFTSKFVKLKESYMKKIIALLSLVISCSSQADYTAENKIIKVVIPQANASGLGVMYQHLEAYAQKQNINMQPIFKPGAAGKIGINYASKEKNDGNTLLLSTISEYTLTNNSDLDAIAPIARVKLTLVASKKSKIKTSGDIIKQEQTQPGKLTWIYGSPSHETFIDNFIKSNNLDLQKSYKVPLSSSAGLQTSIVNGDADLAFILPTSAESLAGAEHLTIVDIDEKTKEKLALKENAVGLFLPKNTNKDANKFWNKFVRGLLDDADFKEAMKNSRSETYTDTSPEKLNKLITNWKL